jgi:hypothetical protein
MVRLSGGDGSLCCYDMNGSGGDKVVGIGVSLRRGEGLLRF